MFASYEIGRIPYDNRPKNKPGVSSTDQIAVLQCAFLSASIERRFLGAAPGTKAYFTAMRDHFN